MNRKQLTLLVVALVAVGGLGFIISKNRSTAWETTDGKVGGKIIEGTPINDVEHIRLKGKGGELNLVKKNDVWTVQERGGYPASFNNIREVLSKVWDLKITQTQKVPQSHLGRLELLPPDKGTNGGTLVEFKDKSGKVLNSLLLGKTHMKQGRNEGPMGMGGGYPDGRYLLVGNEAQTVAIVSDALNSLEAKAESWIDKDFLKVENLRSIAVTHTNATNNWKLTREAAGGEWKLADAKKDESADSGKVSFANYALSSPSVDDVAVDAKPDVTGLDKPIAAKLETFDGFTYDIKLGSKPTDDEKYFLQVAVAANLPKERTTGKDEKPEDKTRLDKEFKEKAEKQDEKVKTEKMFEKWTYLVSKWTVDPLLKERKDLLAEKKDEPKPAEASVTTPPVAVPSATAK